MWRSITLLRLMVKDFSEEQHERHYYQPISRVRRIETRFAQLEEFGARIIRAVSRKGLVVKITLSIEET